MKHATDSDRDRPRALLGLLRVVVILGLPLLAIVVGFWMIGLAQFALVSCLPTLAAAHYLERRTRASASVPLALASKVR